MSKIIIEHKIGLDETIILKSLEKKKQLEEKFDSELKKFISSKVYKEFIGQL